MNNTTKARLIVMGVGAVAATVGGIMLKDMPPAPIGTLSVADVPLIGGAVLVILPGILELADFLSRRSRS